MKVVREHYLRDDITCGSKLCCICEHTTSKQPLEESPFSRSSLCPRAHYLLPDTNVVLHQVNLIPIFTIVVVLFIVLSLMIKLFICGY